MKDLSKQITTQFVELLQRGVDCWVQAGELAAKAIEENPDWPDEVCAQVPWLTPARIYEFQKIGLKKIHPRLMLCDLPGVRALRRLPYKVQETYITQPVELLITNGDTLRVDVHNLTREQADQVFNGDGVRPLAAQRSWLESRAMEKAQPKDLHVEPYIVKRNVLKVNEAGTIFTRKDLIRILAEME